jgi:hypothetical protein
VTDALLSRRNLYQIPEKYQSSGYVLSDHEAMELRIVRKLNAFEMHVLSGLFYLSPENDTIASTLAPKVTAFVEACKLTASAGEPFSSAAVITPVLLN